MTTIALLLIGLLFANMAFSCAPCIGGKKWHFLRLDTLYSSLVVFYWNGSAHGRFMPNIGNFMWSPYAFMHY